MFAIRDAQALVEQLAVVVSAHVAKTLAPLLKRIEELQARTPEKGEKGDPGVPGRDAEPVDLDATARIAAVQIQQAEPFSLMIERKIDQAVINFLKANPVRDGQDGSDGAVGPKGDPGDKGDKGEPGVGLADAFIDRDGLLVLTMTDGRVKSLGGVVGQDGESGRDGAHGIDFDQVTGEVDPERGYVMRMVSGDRTHELVLPNPYHIGFWRAGMSAKAGNFTTHNGNLWLARRDTQSEPTLDAKEDWILAARKGRDGAPGSRGKPDA